MSKMEKNINKWLISLILGEGIISNDPWKQTHKGKKIFHAMIKFFHDGVKELKKSL